MSWSHALEFGCVLFLVALIVAAVVSALIHHSGSWPRQRNHFRRGVLPPPSHACKRPDVEAVP